MTTIGLPESDVACYISLQSTSDYDSEYDEYVYYNGKINGAVAHTGMELGMMTMSMMMVRALSHLTRDMKGKRL